MKRKKNPLTETVANLAACNQLFIATTGKVNILNEIIRKYKHQHFFFSGCYDKA